MESSKTNEHLARVSWSTDLVRLGLPAETETIDPAWFFEAAGQESEGWSLICRFDLAPVEQGSPSTAWVRFMAEDAPHERLTPGALLRLFERGSQKFARVEILG